MTSTTVYHAFFSLPRWTLIFCTQYWLIYKPSFSEVVFILFRKQNKEVLRLYFLYIPKRKSLKQSKKITFIQKLSCMSDQKKKTLQIFIERNMTSKFNRMFSYENKGAAKVSHWASSVCNGDFHRLINLCFFYSQRATKIYRMQMIKTIPGFLSIRQIIPITHV